MSTARPGEKRLFEKQSQCRGVLVLEVAMHACGPSTPEAQLGLPVSSWWANMGVSETG